LRIIAPDRPGAGRTDLRRLRQLADWVVDAVLVLDGLRADTVALLGISAGDRSPPHCAAGIPGRVRSLTLVSPLGPPGWPTRGMAPGERLSLGVATHAPAFGGWSLGRLEALARRSPRLFLHLATSELPSMDRRAIEQPNMRDAFLTSYVEAFRHGSWGAAQDLRVLTRPWGFQLGSVKAPTSIHYGDMDTTVPPQHARLYAEAIPGAQLLLYPCHGHFLILAAREILAALAG
jgi:pimeloyl-ACP methyl ester carboxylesterase